MVELTLGEVDHIVDYLYINGTLDTSKIPGFEQGRRRQKNNDRDINFFLNSDFDFEKQIWKSGFFKIQEKDWAIADTQEYKYPILGMGFTTEITFYAYSIATSLSEGAVINLLKDDRLMFYKNTGIPSYRGDLCDDVPEEKGWCNTKSFRSTYFSSNNPHFSETRNGYVICRDDFGFNLIESKVSLVPQSARGSSSEH